MDDIAILIRRIERERKGRLQAEAIMEKKASELFEANEKLRAWNEKLEQQVRERTVQLRESEEKYRGIIENMELGLLEVNNDDIIIRPYDRFCQMVGYTPEEIIGQKASDIFVDDELKLVISEQNNQRKEGQTGVYEIPIRTKDGSIIWVLISGAPIHNLDGDVVGSIGIHYDISEKKKLIEELAKAKQIAEESQLAEKQFLANMSHEIRTPLNAIIGMAHLLYDTQPTPEQREYVDVLKNSSNFLHALISDILDMSKIESGQLELLIKEIDLLGIIRTHQKAFELKVEGRPIEVEALIDSRLEGTFMGDDLLINQVLNNLLGNAEKFTEAGTIGIRVKQVQRVGEDVVLKFEIYDTGIGIAADQIDIIFQKFKQATLQDRHKVKGTGLGLSIVKQLIEVMGGEIWVDSQLGKGTTFTFTLPLKRTDNTAAHTVQTVVMPFAANQVLSQMVILMVEDNAMNRKYLGTLLDRWKISYDVAMNGKEALLLVQNRKYDLILMDIQMPIMDGYEATVAIRQTSNLNQHTPIVALTASAMNSQKNQAFEAGMNDFLSKPFTPTQLVEKLQKYPATEKQNIAPTLKNSPRFLDSLNPAYLIELYGDDYEYATEMFATFLDEIVPEIFSLPEKKMDIELLRKSIHKIKPTLGMVGLTSLQNQAEQIEQDCTSSQSIEVIMNKLSDFLSEFSQNLPFVQQQHLNLINNDVKMPNHR
jgi:PAS domain S-box-containing protein